MLRFGQTFYRHPIYCKAQSTSVNLLNCISNYSCIESPCKIRLLILNSISHKSHQFEKNNSCHLFILCVLVKKLFHLHTIQIHPRFCICIYLYMVFSYIFETAHNVAADAASLNSNKIPSACYRNELLLFYVIAVWEQPPSHSHLSRNSCSFRRYPRSRYISHHPPYSYIFDAAASRALP